MLAGALLLANTHGKPGEQQRQLSVHVSCTVKQVHRVSSAAATRNKYGKIRELDSHVRPKCISVFCVRVLINAVIVDA